MGLFDYVHCDLSLLPVSDAEREDIELDGGEGGDFQTKSLDRLMKIYDITRSIEHGGCQLFETSTFMTSELHGGAEMEMNPVKLTGRIHFYGSGVSGYCFEFGAHFKDGVLLNIERMKEREHDINSVTP